MLKRKVWCIAAILCVVVVLLVAACSGPTPTAKPSPSPSPSSAPSPSASPTATAKPSPTASPTPTNKLPDSIAVYTFQSGTGGYVQSVSQGKTITDGTGMRILVVPTSSDTAKLLPVLQSPGKMGFWVVGETTSYAAAHGLDSFGVEEWGPQRVRTVYLGPTWYSPYVAKSSSIFTIADLKGKRVSYTEGWATIQTTITGTLAFANLTWKDVVQANVPSSGAFGTAVGDGKADTTWSTPFASNTYEAESKVGGIRWLITPASDTEGWKRLRNYAPYALARKMPAGGAGVDANSGEGICYLYGWYAYEDMDPDIVYAATKALWERYDSYKAVSTILALNTPETACDYQIMMNPYHEGVVRLMKEKGVWTPQIDAWQKQRLALEEARIKAWSDPAVRDAAKAAKVTFGTSGWSKFFGFWHTYLQEHNLISYPVK